MCHLPGREVGHHLLLKVHTFRNSFGYCALHRWLDNK